LGEKRRRKRPIFNIPKRRQLRADRGRERGGPPHSLTLKRGKGKKGELILVCKGERGRELFRETTEEKETSPPFPRKKRKREMHLIGEALGD